MTEENPSLIFVSAQPMEVEMVRGLLKSNGIQAFAIDDRLVPRLTPFYTQELGAIKLFVKPKDLDEASNIIRAHIKGTGNPPFSGAFSSIGASQLNIDAQHVGEPDDASQKSKVTSSKPKKALDLSSPDGFLTIFIVIMVLLFVGGFIRRFFAP